MRRRYATHLPVLQTTLIIGPLIGWYALLAYIFVSMLASASEYTAAEAGSLHRQRGARQFR